jgi:hypothetical protein
MLTNFKECIRLYGEELDETTDNWAYQKDTSPQIKLTEKNLENLRMDCLEAELLVNSDDAYSEFREAWAELGELLGFKGLEFHNRLFGYEYFTIWELTQIRDRLDFILEKEGV